MAARTLGKEHARTRQRPTKSKTEQRATCHTHSCCQGRFPTFELSLWLLLSEVIFCRMNSQVFDALSTLKVVTAPDVDLRQLLGLQTKGPSDVVGED